MEDKDMAKTKEELVSMIENDLVDPTSNKITGERVKSALIDMVDAMGTGSGGAAFEYWEAASDNEILMGLSMYSVTAKINNSGTITILPAGLASLTNTPIMAICWCPGLKFYTEDMGGLFTSDYLLEMILTDSGASSLEELGFTRITEEQYFTI